jgi:soluble lytic murein transglycosylase
MAANVSRALALAARPATLLLMAGFCLIPGRLTSAPATQAAPLNESDLWLLPATGRTPALGGAAADLAAGNAAAALPVFAAAAREPMLGGYARLYHGRAELGLNRLEAAALSARLVIAAKPAGPLAEAALWLQAEAAEQAGKWTEATRSLQALTELDPSDSTALLRLGRAAFKADMPVLSTQSFTRLYFDLPLSSEAAEAESELRRYFRWPPASQTFERTERRAEQLYAGRRYTDARKAFESLMPLADPDRQPMIRLRLAQCDFYLRRYAAARDGLRAHLDVSPVGLEEATYFYLGALRELRRETEYVAEVARFVDAHPTSVYAESALNDLATYYILANQDQKAAGVFDEMTRRFPAGTFGDRAAWRAGWWAYKQGEYEKTVRLFDAAAVTYPRADFRPPWLYWSARANERLGRLEAAVAGYQRTISSYRNSFYGRQATERLEALRPRDRPTAGTLVPAATVTRPLRLIAGGAPPLPNASLVRSLLAAGLYDDAIAELRWAERDTGPSPFIEATIAYALNRKGELRPGITAMRRAYPQFMAEGGEALPTPILKVIFPIDHTDLIQRYARARKLDPFLITALVAQESTFQADVRSAANAWGLMQILPSTGRRYALSLRIPRFSTSRLTDPEVNVRIGTAYFADLMDQFGDVAHALAAYNAGENRVARWRAERPGAARDEFIDDIPFPETQNYVKRVIGTAEDYRILYGSSGAPLARATTR